jgi:hypothetical protein
LHVFVACNIAGVVGKAATPIGCVSMITFKNYSLICSRGLVACSIAILKQGGNGTLSLSFALTKKLKHSLHLNVWSSSPWSLILSLTSNQTCPAA